MAKKSDDKHDLIMKVLGERSRLQILTFIATSEEKEVSFTDIKKHFGFTSGNLSVQLKNLDKAGFIVQKKRFVDNKPLTTNSITGEGVDALNYYIQSMESIINNLKANKAFQDKNQ